MKEGRRDSCAAQPFGAGGTGGGCRSVGHAMTKFLYFIDGLSTWVGKSFAWLILVLTLGISYEVFVRYALARTRRPGHSTSATSITALCS